MKKTIFIFFLSGSIFAQGPVDGFMKKKTEFSLGLSFSREKANEMFAGPNLVSVNRTTRAASFFGIYGITDKLNIQVGIPYLDVNKGIEKGFQDGSIYLKYNLLKKENAFGEIRTMVAAGYADPLSNYQTENSSSIGQMAMAGDARIIVHQSFKSNLFATLQGGYIFKSEPTPHAIASSLKIGYAGKLYVDVYYELIHALGGTDYRGVGDLQPTSARGGFESLGFSYQKIGGTIYYGIHKHFGAFGGVSYILDGRNTFKNTGFSLGFVFQ